MAMAEEANRGMLVLNTQPANLDMEEEILSCLNKYFKNVPREKLSRVIRKAPVVLSKNVSQKAGSMVISQLRSIGASAEFVTEPSQETFEQQNGVVTNGHESPHASHDTGIHQEKATKMIASKPSLKADWKALLKEKIEEVNKELWLVLSMFVLVGIMNYMVTSQRIMLGLYTLPTILSAYFYGRRHATLTALASVLLVGFVVYFNPALLTEDTATAGSLRGKWFDLATWGSILMVTAYAMGSLYERNKMRMRELQQTYRGLLVILRHFISKDQYTENHCYRVSIYAAKIASYLGLSSTQIEDIRSAAFLHDIGKLEISRDLLHKAAQLTSEEFEGMKKHVDTGVTMLETIGSPLGRVLPIILSHHEKFDGSGYFESRGDDIPLEARVLSVADVYDALTSDRPYRKAMSPFEAKEIIEKNTDKDFDPRVVNAFLKAFRKGEMDIPNVVL